MKKEWPFFCVLAIASHNSLIVQAFRVISLFFSSVARIVFPAFPYFFQQSPNAFAFYGIAKKRLLHDTARYAELSTAAGPSGNVVTANAEKMIAQTSWPFKNQQS